MTHIDRKLAMPDYWWNQPAVAQVISPDFYKLWRACEAELHSRFFQVDREEYRDGLLTSRPLVTKQAFEPWRTDAVTFHDVLEGTFATVRRTVHFEITRQNDGTFALGPKVLVERFASTERRITGYTQYHQAFSSPHPYENNLDEQGQTIPNTYWYPLHRDETLEKDLAESVRDRLKL